MIRRYIHFKVKKFARELGCSISDTYRFFVKFLENMPFPKPKEKYYTNAELEEIIAHLSDSDDNFDLSDDEDENSDVLNIEAIPIEFDDGVVINADGEEVEGTNEEIANENNRSERDFKQESIELKMKYSKLVWRKKKFILSEEAKKFSYTGNNLCDSFTTPFQFFKHLFSNEIMKKITDESNLYISQKNINDTFTVTIEKLAKFLGICVYMSVVHMPNVRSYWATSLGFPQIKNVMSQKLFEKIKSAIHFNNNGTMIPRGEPNHDRLHKIRPIVDLLNERFQTVPLQECLSVDEQMCATKARNYLKQYLPAKPHKWGYKLFVLCGTDGYAYHFEIYSGAGQENLPKSDEPELGSCANVVVRLCRIIPPAKNFKVYFDNYYSTVPLVVHLARRGIFSLGTVRKNRVPNSKIPSDSDMKKKARGTSEECVTTVEGVEVTCVTWKDNKLVNLLSTFAGQEPLGEIRRYDRKQSKYITISCPNIVQIYNKHMGGVDLLDGLIGRYKIKIRTKKWYMRLFYHLLDVTLVNSWIIYKKTMLSRNEKHVLNLAEFRSEIAYCLCNYETGGPKRRGRPSEIETQIEEKRKRSATTAYVPPKDVRLDGNNHWPVYEATRQRCKLPSCKSFSFIKCSKCALHFCLNKSNNCFFKFHTC